MGSRPRARAMTGSAGDRMVESVLSMNRAVAITSRTIGTRICQQPRDALGVSVPTARHTTRAAYHLDIEPSEGRLRHPVLDPRGTSKMMRVVGYHLAAGCG